MSFFNVAPSHNSKKKQKRRKKKRIQREQETEIKPMEIGHAEIPFPLGIPVKRK